jgi:hypothetical protein
MSQCVGNLPHGELTDAGRVGVHRTGIAARLHCRNIVPTLGITELIASQFGGSLLHLAGGVVFTSASYCVEFSSPDNLVTLQRFCARTRLQCSEVRSSRTASNFFNISPEGARRWTRNGTHGCTIQR